MSRWKASFIHLLISFLVVGSVAAYIVYFWYPPALMNMAKADRLLMLIAGVDLIVGPLLTLIIYKAGKPKLKMDLTIIALVQFCFLAYGLHVTWNSRPVFLVAVPDRFELVFANEITPARLAEAKIERFKKLGFGKPVLVGAIMPSDPKAQEQIMMSALRKQGDLQQMPKYYIEYSDARKSLLTFAKPLVAGKGLSEEDAETLRAAAESYGYSPDKVSFLTLASSRGFASMLVKSGDAEIIGPVNVDP